MASAPTVEYTNVLKFYSDTGVLLYSTIIPYTQVCYWSYDSHDSYNIVCLIDASFKFLLIIAAHVLTQP